MKEDKFTTIQQALENKAENVSLRGWVYRERKSNKFVFIVLRDESNIIQCVISKNKTPEPLEKGILRQDCQGGEVVRRRWYTDLRACTSLSCTRDFSRLFPVYARLWP